MDRSILDEAWYLIGGPRQASYGSPSESMSRIALVWSGILGVSVDARQVALCMAGLKLAREANRPKRDNRVDSVAYVLIADDLADVPPSGEPV